MSKYTTGEMAKMAGVSVRTVQYYDTRGILSPSDLSEGGRRLYNDDDLQRLKIICYLRGLGLPISSISELFDESNPEEVIAMVLNQQEAELKKEINQQQEQLDNLSRLKRELSDINKVSTFSLKSIGDVAHKMENRKKLHGTRRTMVIVGGLADVLEWGTLLLWIFTGNWKPFVCCLPIVIGLGIGISRYYFNRVNYICPECHSEFSPSKKEAFFAKHTLNLRKVTCTHCGHKGFCMEVHNQEK